MDAKLLVDGKGTQPTCSAILLVVAQHLKWLAASLAIIGVINNISDFRSCNEQGCLYFVAFSRKYQPSSISWSAITSWENPFRLVSNRNISTDFFDADMSWGSSSSAQYIEQMCESLKFRSKILQDLNMQASMIALVIFLIIDCLLMIAHDLLLLFASPSYDVAERYACSIGYMSWISWGFATMFAMIWSMGLAETFVALDPESGHACFYQLDTLNMLASATAVFSMYVQFHMRAPKLWRAAFYGDHLYAFNDQVSFDVVRENLKAGIVPDAVSSLQHPMMVTEEGASLEVFHCDRTTLRELDRKSLARRLMSTEGLNCLIMLVVAMLPGSRDLPYFNFLCTISWIVLAWFRSLLRHWIYQTVLPLNEEASQTWHDARTKRMCKRIGNQVTLKLSCFWVTDQRRHIIPRVYRISNLVFLASGVTVMLARAGLLLLKFLPWLGPATADPAHALALGLHLTWFMVLAAYTYQIYVRFTFASGLVHVIHTIAKGIPASKELNEMIDAASSIPDMTIQQKYR